jgi:CBS domain-containing protein
MQLRNLMSHDVTEIPPSASLREAAERMRSLDVGALPVCENHKLIGMITDRDITVRATADGRNPEEACVRDAMTRDLIFCYEDEDVERAAKLMEERQIRRLPVLDHDMKLTGIVSLGDLATRQSSDRLSGEVLEQVSRPGQTHA